jgi:hypothetical protein
MSGSSKRVADAKQSGFIQRRVLKRQRRVTPQPEILQQAMQPPQQQAPLQPPPNLPPLPLTPPQLQAKETYEAAARKAQPSFDAAERALAQNPLPQGMATVQQTYATASGTLDTTLRTPNNYGAAMQDLLTKEHAAKAVLTAKAQADAAAMKARRTAGQKAQYEDMKGLYDEVQRTYFAAGAAGSSDRVRKEKLSPGKHFSGYLTALAQMEQSRAAVPKSGAIPAQAVQDAKRDADALVVAAQAYLTHYEQDFSSREKKDKTNLRKFQIVSEGIKAARQFSLAMDMQSIPEPTAQAPWDRVTETRAGGLRAATDFETGYKKGSSLKEGGEAGTSEAFWVESQALGSAKAAKTAIFKPTKGEEQTSRDHIKGGGAAREALASANAKLFAEQTGFDMGIPETQVTTIAAHALDLKGNEADGQPRIGSLQAFEKSDGALIDLPPTALRGIPADQCRKIAVHDIMAMNFDRHPGNLLMRNPPDGGPPEMVPIDHGATLPTRNDFDELANNIGGLVYKSGTVNVKNAMLGLPGAYEKFDPETTAKLDLMDPDAMVQGMRDQAAALDQVNPGMNARATLSDETLEMARRNMLFLKKAAHELSPAEIQLAIGQHGHMLFDADDGDFDDIANTVIAAMKPKGEAYKEIFTTSAQRRDDIFITLEKNGWAENYGKIGEWVMEHPVEALKLYKSGAVNPAMQNNDDVKFATQQDIDNFLPLLDDDQVLSQSAALLIQQASDHLQGVDPAVAATLDPLRQQAAALLGQGDTKGGEAAAREFETQAMYLALKPVREAAEALYANRDARFPGMGTDAEEQEKLDKTRDATKKQALRVKLNSRRLADGAYNNVMGMTGPKPNLAEAKENLEKLRARLG